MSFERREAKDDTDGEGRRKREAQITLVAVYFTNLPIILMWILKIPVMMPTPISTLSKHEMRVGHGRRAERASERRTNNRCVVVTGR